MWWRMIGGVSENMKKVNKLFRRDHPVFGMHPVEPTVITGGGDDYKYPWGPLNEKKATLIRHEETIDGTFGELLFDGELFCKTLELPWRDNKRNVSCIPLGLYRCIRRSSRHFGMVYEVVDVPERDGILFHPGNLISDIRGCIAVGMSYGYLGSVRGVLNSRLAFNKLMDIDLPAFDINFISG